MSWKDGDHSGDDTGHGGDTDGSTHGLLWKARKKCKDSACLGDKIVSAGIGTEIVGKERAYLTGKWLCSHILTEK